MTETVTVLLACPGWHWVRYTEGAQQTVTVEWNPSRLPVAQGGGARSYGASQVGVELGN